MNLSVEKAEIIKKLKETNEEWVIKSIKKLLDIRDDDDEVIGNVAGEPYTKYQLRKDIEEGEKEFERGEYIEQKDIKKELKKLRNK